MTHKYKVTIRKTIEYTAYVFADDSEDAYDSAVAAVDNNQSWVNWSEDWSEWDYRDVEREECDYDPDAARDDRDCLLYAELHG